VDPRPGVEVERRKILPLTGIELRPLDRPDRSRSLNRMHYPGSPVDMMYVYYKLGVRRSLNYLIYNSISRTRLLTTHSVQST
jgi:hypothetical protein